LAQYYYLVASLPLLFYDTEKFPSREAFLDTCRRHVTARHYRLLVSASTTDLKPSIPSCRTLDLWREWEIALRNELVRLRAKNRGIEAEPYLVSSPPVMDAQAAAREAFDQESPLQAEDLLNRARWRYLEELAVGHYFDMDKILVYALHLQVLARKALFDEEKGKKMFEELYAEITGPIYEKSRVGED
jgi:hypothetical protein